MDKYHPKTHLTHYLIGVLSCLFAVSPAIAQVSPAIAQVSPAIAQTTHTPKETKTFTIEQQEGAQNKPRYVSALKEWLNTHDCDVSITITTPATTFLTTKASSSPDTPSAPGTPSTLPQLLFSVVPMSQLEQATGRDSYINNYDVLAEGLTTGNMPLSIQWLSHKKQKLSSLKSLENERIAILHAPSLIGHQLALTSLANAGVKVDQNSLYYTTTYQGAVALLLHRNVRSAAVAGPLANRWKNANDLHSISETSSNASAKILRNLATPPPIARQCANAFNQLKRSSKRDMRMKLFPEWVEGFSILTQKKIDTKK